MCPVCASVGVMAFAGVVSSAGVATLLIKLRNHNVNPREMSS